MKGGYAGAILHIDLTTGEFKKEPLDDKVVLKFIGGFGINNWLYYNLQKPGMDPFSPDSPIVIGAGALVGTLAPGASKVIATYKSPIFARDDKHIIDNTVAGSNRFGIMLKNAGYDHLIITGRANRPVYLKIIDDDVEICDAVGLWGKKDVYETSDFLIDRHVGSGVISIGRAGEGLVRYAMAIVDYFGTFGKLGFGAVLGSKNVKAIVTCGSKGLKVANPKKFTEIVNSIHESARKVLMFLESFHTLGIASGWAIQAPLVSEGNWTNREWTKLYGPKKWAELKKSHNNLACNGCILACKVDYEIKDGEFKGLFSSTGHFMLPARIGQRLEIYDPKKAVKLLDICNRAGMCALTTSGIVNWVTKLYEDGIITKRDTGGLELQRDFESYLSLFEMIIKREGFGDTLADGWYPISKKIGVNPDEFEPGPGIVKGVDSIRDGRFSTFDCERFANITNPRPHHGGLESRQSLAGLPLGMLKEDIKNMGTSEDEFERVFESTPYYGRFNVARYAKHCEDVMAVYNGVGTCVSTALLPTPEESSLKLITSLYSAATGIEISVEELKRLGERAFNLFKVLNVREGFSRRDDVCPRVWLLPRDTPDGKKIMFDYYKKRAISEEDIEKLLDDYYFERGWDIKEGIPTKKKLIELGLEDISESVIEGHTR